jgi:hypothetical protein
LRDFTINAYSNLLIALQQQGYDFLCFKDFQTESGNHKNIVLRHDVDARKVNSLLFARIEHSMGIRGTYYFRIVPQSFDEKIIKEIYSLGHEIGYHYEDFAFIAERQKTKLKRQKWDSKEDYEKYLAEIAILNFEENLMKFRKIAPVKTICMHGSPMSSWDNRLLWKYYDYHDFGIVSEPYFDVEFNRVLYLTDTGRRWDGASYNIRDNVSSVRKRGADSKMNVLHRSSIRFLEKQGNTELDTLFQKSIPQIHSTFDIIEAVNENRLPDKIMMTFHPQRWTNSTFPWFKELVWQNVKNSGKYLLIKLRG